MSKLLVIICGFVLATVVAPVDAQPFFGDSAVAFQPEIGLVGTGVVMNPTAVVSEDRHYVKIGMRLQSSQLLAIQPFQTTVVPGGTLPQQGFVGGVNPTMAVMPISDSPAAIQQRAVIATSVLSQRGIFLLHVN